MTTITIGPDYAIRVVNTETGEMLDHVDILDLSRDAKAALYGAACAITSNLSTLRTQLKAELEELHKEGQVESAGSYGGVKLKRTSSRRWDVKRVPIILERLVEQGDLTAARAAAAAPKVETVKPDGRKLNALLQELAGTEAGADLASTKTDSVIWSAEIVQVDDVAPVPDQDEPATPAADPTDAFFGAEAA